MTHVQTKSKLLLVDYENVQQVRLAMLDEGYRVVVFVGASQRNIPLELVTDAQRLGSRVEWQKVAGEGRNALDFFIACHLGRVMERAPGTECIVLSKDKGFDPLLRQLNAAGLVCRRINSLQELRPAAASGHVPAAPSGHAPARRPAEHPNVRRVVDLLGKLEKKGRPRKRRTLAQSISAMFQKKLSRDEVDGIIDQLIADRLIVETDGNVTYEF